MLLRKISSLILTPYYQKTEIILDANISALQYRKKNATYLQKFDEASALKSLCTKYNTPFIINDDIKLATEIEADGIHLGEHDDSCKNARSKLGNNKTHWDLML